jgi:2-polyprenyl-3-methyl-5-hydroxy-6-metoxy-1,4-benzoquinol methylase
LNNTWKRYYGYDIGLDEKYGNPEIELRKCSDCGLLYYAPQIIEDARLYETLQKFSWYYMQEKEEYDFALNFIPPDAKVLEIGPGNGAFARKLTCESYTGLEMSEGAIKEAQEMGLGGNNKKIIKERIEDHAQNAPESYDVVCAFQVLEHVPEVSSFLKSSLNCLKSGGTLIISLPGEDSWLARGVNNILNAPPHHLTRWTDACLNNLAALNNLKVTKLEPEKLCPVHLTLYSVSLVQYVVGKLFLRNPGVVDPRFARLPARWAIRGLALVPEFFLKVLRMRPRGHTVTVIYEKK